ncbi:MAG: glycerol kinase GlpK [Anaerolineaceae bacterium]|nr:glycerol kinase GlpK [Anaerolineaceae bacterium]
MEKFIAAIDQGTTSTRCILFNRAGEVAALDQKEHTQIYPKPGWVEHNPREIWANAQTTLKNAMRKVGASSADIHAIGVTNQRETTIAWDKHTGNPYYNAIVWQDVRTAEICNALSLEDGTDRFRQKTGLPLATYFSGPKIKWLLENIPEIKKSAYKGDLLFGTVDTWLIWQLTGGVNGGVFITDVTNASRTMLMNLHTLDWDPEILEALGIPRELLPAIQPSSAIYGYSTGVVDDIPVSGNLGDQQAALFGQTCFLPGEVKNTYGTGCFMLMNTGGQPVQSKNGLLTTLGYKIGNQPAVYCLEGSVAIAGALVQWLRDNLKMIEQSSDIESLAQTVQDNGGVYIVPAFSGLFAPYWRSDARGVFVGLTRYVTRGHIARAALESTAYQTREVLDITKSDSGVKISALKVDGGMTSNQLLMQFQADILNIPVIRPHITETTALGSAYAAGLATGFWSGLDDLKAKWKKDKEWFPSMDADVREKQYTMWKKAVSKTFNWID